MFGFRVVPKIDIGHIPSAMPFQAYIPDVLGEPLHFKQGHVSATVQRYYAQPFSISASTT